MERGGIRSVQFKLLVNKRRQLFSILGDRTPQLIVAQLFATHISFLGQRCVLKRARAQRALVQYEAKLSTARSRMTPATLNHRRKRKHFSKFVGRRSLNSMRWLKLNAELRCERAPG